MALFANRSSRGRCDLTGIVPETEGVKTVTALDQRVPSKPATGAAPENAAGGSLLGLPSATALVIGSIIGTGVFTMPAVMAGAGTMSLITLGIIAICAVLLGTMFGQLTKRVPHAEGGLYAYARHEFGDFAGYLTAWCYWITAWAGNAAIVASWVLYVESLLGIQNPSGWTNVGIAMTGLWIPAVINLAGVRQMAWFQNVTVVLKFLPLALVGVFGWFFIHAANFGPFNASGGSFYSGISIAAGVALVSFIGVECAAIAGGRVKNPRKNVGRASVIGTALSAVLYLTVTGAVMGLVAHSSLINNGAPFVDAFQTMFGKAWIVGKIVALVAVISGIGALNGWTLVTAEMPWAAARDGLFPRQFLRMNSKGALSFGIVVSTIVASLLMAYSYTGGTGLKVFTYLVDLSVVTVAIPYFMSACAQLAFLVSGRRKVHGVPLVRDLGIVTVAGLFSMWTLGASGYQAVYQAMILVLIGIPIYAFLKASKEREGTAVAPVDQLPEPLELDLRS
jgi:APA family basic amino acid/polyamine antiporter